MSRQAHVRLLKWGSVVGYAVCFFAATWLVEGWRAGVAAVLAGAGGMLFCFFVFVLVYEQDAK